MDSNAIKITAPRFRDPEEWFHSLATSYVESQIYFHLNQCGVFQYLLLGGSAKNIAESLKLDERILESLLDYSANVGDIICVDEYGLYCLTNFGHEVVERYGKKNGDRTVYNMFDVRVGAWGPVWANLSELLRKSKIYGIDVHRAGEHAADGLFKLASPLSHAVNKAATELSATTIVELGPTSGIMAILASAKNGSNRRYVGIDIKQESLDLAMSLAQERGVSFITWQLGDIFVPETWINLFNDDERILFFSCHFHEFLSQGIEKMERVILKLSKRSTTVGIQILEQPRLPIEQRYLHSSTRWKYSESNVLIHHLIKNARILYDNEWQNLLRKGGCHDVVVSDAKGFGFRSYIGMITKLSGEKYA